MTEERFKELAEECGAQIRNVKLSEYKHSFYLRKNSLQYHFIIEEDKISINNGNGNLVYEPIPKEIPLLYVAWLKEMK